MRTRNYNER